MKVYFEERGYGMGKVSIKAYVNPTKDGHAYSFNSDGKKYIWAWASPSRARVYDHTQLPEDLWFSIKNGSDDMKIPENKRENWDFSDLSYHKIEKEQVKATKYVYRQIKNVKTLDEFKKLYPYIKKCAFYIPEVVYKLCELCGVGEVPMVNGELGLAFYKQVCIYNHILKELGIE
jgi:hypothetical protein